MADRSKAEVVLDLFGVNLEQQGRGFYVSLELLAIARGVYEVDPSALLDKDAFPVSYRRSSHDFARRVAVGSVIDEETLKAAIDEEDTRATLQALSSSLLVEIPGRRKSPNWYNTHLYPFVGELIHYDAAERWQAGLPRGTKMPHIERYVFRKGGTWAYRVLRTDADDSRRAATREGLLELVRDSRSPLGEISHRSGATTTRGKTRPTRTRTSRRSRPSKISAHGPSICDEVCISSSPAPRCLARNAPKASCTGLPIASHGISCICLGLPWRSRQRRCSPTS